MHTIRKTSGLAGFPKRDESIHDAFGVGHSSTSISAGLGKILRFLYFKTNTYFINLFYYHVIIRNIYQLYK